MRVTEDTLNRYRRTNRRIKLYTMSNGTITVNVAAYTEDHARDIIEDYANFDFGKADLYDSIAQQHVKSTGVKSFVVES